MKTAPISGALSCGTRVLLGGVGTHIGELNMLKNGDTPTPSRQQVSCCDSVDDLDFARDLVAFSGADHLLAVARYEGGADGAHVEIYGPLPRCWRQMIPPRRRRGAPRIGWRNSRGGRLHPVDFTQVGELAAELVEQRGARRSQ